MNQGPLETGNGLQFTASKKREPIFQLQGTEFCQPLNEREMDSPQESPEANTACRPLGLVWQDPH